MKLFASILSVVFFTTAPTVLLAKGDTVKITIEGTALPSPIEITDPAVRQFNLWSGPGTFMNGVEGRQGFIIDWTNRLDEAPVGLHHYRVSFYEGCELRESAPCRTGERSLVYVVYYDCNPSTEQRLPNQDGLTIKVLEGEDGVNIIQKNTAVKPVVEVRDRNNLPVAGATVVFILPDSGPSATFARGSRVLTVRTNSAGRASATSIYGDYRPNQFRHRCGCQCGNSGRHRSCGCFHRNRRWFPRVRYFYRGGRGDRRGRSRGRHGRCSEKGSSGSSKGHARSWRWTGLWALALSKFQQRRKA